MQFFLLVRDQRYDEAYTLGMKILKESPGISAVENFCDFIRKNFKGLEEMVQEEREFSDGEEEEEEDDDG